MGNRLGEVHGLEGLLEATLVDLNLVLPARYVHLLSVRSGSGWSRGGNHNRHEAFCGCTTRALAHAAVTGASIRAARAVEIGNAANLCLLAVVSVKPASALVRFGALPGRLGVPSSSSGLTRSVFLSAGLALPALIRVSSAFTGARGFVQHASVFAFSDALAFTLSICRSAVFSTPLPDVARQRLAHVILPRLADGPRVLVRRAVGESEVLDGLEVHPNHGQVAVQFIFARFEESGARLRGRGAIAHRLGLRLHRGGPVVATHVAVGRASSEILLQPTVAISGRSNPELALRILAALRTACMVLLHICRAGDGRDLHICPAHLLVLCFTSVMLGVHIPPLPVASELQVEIVAVFLASPLAAPVFARGARGTLGAKVENVALSVPGTRRTAVVKTLRVEAAHVVAVRGFAVGVGELEGERRSFWHLDGGKTTHISASDRDAFLLD